MIRVVSLFVALLLLFGAAASLGAPGSAAAANGVTVVVKGSCVVAGGVAKNWDVWQEVFETGAPTWLQAHTHQGAECILTLRGIGAPFRTDVQSASAPPIQSTALKSYFKTLFPNQPRREGAFMIANRIEQLGPGGGYERPRSTGDAYYTVVHGSATIVIGAASTTLTQYQSLVIPRHTAARISNAASGADDAMLAVTELLPKK